MERELFKRMLSDLIAGEQRTGEYPLDLRAGKAPFSHKDNEVFSIDDLDGVYNYVKDSKEWFVDIYANTLIGKFPHADFTGCALTSLVFEEALKKSAPMTAEEKFDARLKELGIYDDWCQQGCVGRVGVETSEGIKILVHEDEDDKFTEFTYPPMREMEKSDQFRIKTLGEFYPAMCDDSDFRDKLVRWVIDPRNVCPLYPVDVYFPWEKAEWQDFEDDVQENTDKPTEFCVNCLEDVDIENEFKVQKCPKCGEWLVPCSLCPLEECPKICPLERMASILSEKESSQR